MELYSARRERSRHHVLPLGSGHAAAAAEARHDAGHTGKTGPKLNNAQLRYCASLAAQGSRRAPYPAVGRRVWCTCRHGAWMAVFPPGVGRSAQN